MPTPELTAVREATQQCEAAAALLDSLDDQYQPIAERVHAAADLCARAGNAIWLHQERQVPIPETANIPEQYQQLAQPDMPAFVRRMVDNAVHRQELRRRVDAGEKQADIARELGVRRQAVSLLVSKARREVPDAQ